MVTEQRIKTSRFMHAALGNVHFNHQNGGKYAVSDYDHGRFGNFYNGWSAQITTEMKSISEYIKHQSLTQEGYSSRRPRQDSLLSAKNKSCTGHKSKKSEQLKTKNVAWSDNSLFMLRHTDRVRSFPLLTVQAGRSDIMVWAMFSWHILAWLIPINHHLNATVYLNIVAKWCFEHVCHIIKYITYKTTFKKHYMDKTRHDRLFLKQFRATFLLMSL